MIKSNRMGWAVHIVHMLEKCMELLVAKHGVRDHFEDLDTGGQ